jgi:hypothetical protein
VLLTPAPPGLAMVSCSVHCALALARCCFRVAGDLLRQSSENGVAPSLRMATIPHNAMTVCSVPG